MKNSRTENSETQKLTFRKTHVAKNSRSEKLTFLVVLILFIPSVMVGQFEKIKPFGDNKILVKNGDRDLQKLTHDIAHVYGFEGLKIEIYRLPSSSKFKATVTREGEKHFKIYLQRSPYYETALLHEFWHIKQMIKGQLKIEGKHYHWKGERFTGVPYRKRQHEKEAYRESKKLKKVLRFISD